MMRAPIVPGGQPDGGSQAAAHGGADDTQNDVAQQTAAAVHETAGNPADDGTEDQRRKHSKTPYVI